MSLFVLGLILGGPTWALAAHLASGRPRRRTPGVTYTLSTYDRRRRLP